MNLLVLGASGGCGQWICRIARERGHHVRALVRPPTPFYSPADVEVVRGEVLEDGVIERALEGRDAVVSALGIKRRMPSNPWSAIVSPPDLTTRVAERLVDVMPRHGVRRLVAISAGGVGDSIGRVHPVIRWMIGNSNMAVSYDDLKGMETVLSGSGLDWMCVRPTTLTSGPPTGSARVVDRYGLSTRISRADVAWWMLDSVERSQPFQNRSPMIATRGRSRAG